MKISETGEFAIIDDIVASFKELLPVNMKGIGDDCALIPKNENESYVISTDMLVEDHHFYKNKISAFDLGFKSLAVNLSDIAAMGARPVASFLSVALPRDLEKSWVDEFIAGYKSLSVSENVPLCGGDTVASEKLTVNVTIIGEALNASIRFRSMARLGDDLCCTKTLGDSAGGFLLLQADTTTGNIEKILLESHYKPYPEIAAGKWLAAQKGVHAMIDISDGLVADLRHILSASGVAAFLNREAIPISASLKEAAKKHNWNSLELALNGGEDYCLLFTIDKTETENITKGFLAEFGRPLYILGGIEAGSGHVRLLEGENEISYSKKGFTHF